MLFSETWGNMIHEKIPKQKISWHCPFKRWKIKLTALFPPFVSVGWVWVRPPRDLHLLQGGEVRGWGGEGRAPGPRHRPVLLCQDLARLRPCLRCRAPAPLGGQGETKNLVRLFLCGFVVLKGLELLYNWYAMDDTLCHWTCCSWHSACRPLFLLLFSFFLMLFSSFFVLFSFFLVLFSSFIVLFFSFFVLFFSSVCRSSYAVCCSSHSELCCCFYCSLFCVVFLILSVVRFIVCIVHDNLCVILIILHVCVSWLSLCCLVTLQIFLKIVYVVLNRFVEAFVRLLYCTYVL